MFAPSTSMHFDLINPLQVSGLQLVIVSLVCGLLLLDPIGCVFVIIGAFRVWLVASAVSSCCWNFSGEEISRLSPVVFAPGIGGIADERAGKGARISHQIILIMMVSTSNEYC